MSDVSRKSRRQEAWEAFDGLPWRADYVNEPRHKRRNWTAATKIDGETKLIVFAQTLERLQEIVAVIEPELSEVRVPREEWSS